MAKTERCPRCDYVIWLTDEACLPSAPEPVKKDKPDPQDKADGDDIVEAFKRYHDSICFYGAANEQTHRNQKRLARLIQAGIQKNEKKIEAVRKEAESANSGVMANCDRFGRTGDSLINSDLGTLERKVGDCVKHDSAWVEQITQWRKETKCRIKELENKVSQVLPDLTPAKPPVAKNKAYAPDKDGKKHELKPGRSVIKGSAVPTAVFYSDKGGGLLRVRWLNTGLYGTMHLQNVNWLFDLGSCGDKGTFPPGGDK